MNYKRLALLLAGTLIALLGVMLVRTLRERPTPSIDTVSDIRWLKETLQLTPAQTDEIQRLHQELAKTLAQYCGEHCRARAALMESLFSSTNGLTRSQAFIDDMARAQAASELATLVNIYRVHDLLTPRQRDIYERQVKSMDCTMRSANGSSVCGCMVKGKE